MSIKSLVVVTITSYRVDTVYL